MWQLDPTFYTQPNPAKAGKPNTLIQKKRRQRAKWSK